MKAERAAASPGGQGKKSFSKCSEKPLANFKASMMSSDLHFEKIPVILTEVNGTWGLL